MTSYNRSKRKTKQTCSFGASALFDFLEVKNL